MLQYHCLFVLLVLSVCEKCTQSASLGSQDEEKAKLFMQWYEEAGKNEFNSQVYADWDYQTNVTEENSDKLSDVQLKFAAFNKLIWENVTSYDWKNFKDEDLRRRFEKLSVLGIAILPSEDLKQFNDAISRMQTIYAKTKICSYDNPAKCDLNLEPEITEIMAKSRNYEELKHTWKEWHDKSGQPMRPSFETYVRLGAQAAHLNDFKDMGQMWRLPYESKTFVQDVADLWKQLKPFYEQLHAYVRRKLRIFYGNDKVPTDGPIPAHILGNMWSQDWNNIYDISLPYDDVAPIDVTDEMKAQGYDVNRMFKTSDEFFTSVGLFPLNDIFWDKSMLEKPDERDVVCHASAWDFYDKKDFRIKMCTEINMIDLITIHHEMGHIQYFMQYKNQPLPYKDGANPGFHEAVGDTLALSVSTPKHLEKIGLLKNAESNYKADINFLYKMSLDKIAFLPFGYVIDLWRWQVFEDKVTSDDYNSKWWELRKEIQGITPPVTRSEEDFDPGAKYHVAADVPYIRYFVSFVIQFQFYKALCLEAGEYVENDPTKPLYSCDIYQNKDAGKLLSDMLELGSSKPWPEAMAAITRGASNKMDASALIEYFDPLIKYLKEENSKNNEFIGWKD